MKKKIIFILIFILIILVVIGIVYFNVQNSEKENNIQNNEELLPPTQFEIVEEFVEVLDNGIKQNTSTKFKEKKIFNGLEMNDIDYYMSNGQTYLEANITNKSGKDFETTAVNVIIYDKDGSEITRMGGVIEELKNGETKQFNCATTLDFANAYDFKIEVIK